MSEPRLKLATVEFGERGGRNWPEESDPYAFAVVTWTTMEPARYRKEGESPTFTPMDRCDVRMLVPRADLEALLTPFLLKALDRGRP